MVGLVVLDRDDRAATSQGGRSCTAIGCRSGVGFHLGELPESAHKIRLCVDRRCAEPSPKRTYVFVPAASPAPARVTASIRVTFAGEPVALVREIDLDLETTRPNGPGCPPTCRSAAVRFEPRSRRLYAAPGFQRP